MKLKLMIPALLLGALSMQAALADGQAPADDNMIGLTTPNGKLVYDFIDLWFNQHKGAEAFDKYVSRTNYVNHAVYSASTKNPHKSFEQERDEEARAIPPTSKFEIKQLITQGSLVFAHILAHAGPSGPGDEMLMILRVRDGKITDHWDVHVELKDDSMVFQDLNH